MILLIGLVVLVSSSVIGNAFDSVDTHKNLSAFINHETAFLKVNLLSCDKLLPLVKIQLLHIFMNPVHIGVNISIEREGILIILEHEWECFYLVRQSNIHLFIAALS